ncbi:MAG: hypothetical protein ACRDTJ_21995 [Pseudonocardiaceae bacterium]
MATEAPQATQDRWRDVEGAHISLFCWVEQVAEDPDPAALFPRLHQWGQVLGRGLHSLYVCFSDNALVSLPPHMLRLLPDAPGEVLMPTIPVTRARERPCAHDHPRCY